MSYYWTPPMLGEKLAWKLLLAGEHRATVLIQLGSVRWRCSEMTGQLYGYS